MSVWQGPATGANSILCSHSGTYAFHCLCPPGASGSAPGFCASGCQRQRECEELRCRSGILHFIPCCIDRISHMAIPNYIRGWEVQHWPPGTESMTGGYYWLWLEALGAAGLDNRYWGGEYVRDRCWLHFKPVDLEMSLLHPKGKYRK